jgi:hypothetical protein
MKTPAFADMRSLGGILMFLAIVIPVAEAAEKLPDMRSPRPIEGAINHLDIAYLPDRLTGSWEDRWLKMNVHVPTGAGPFPCLIFVHGGGYGAGDKDGGLWNAGPGSEFSTRVRAVTAGYVVVNVNYILSYGGSSQPQVFWDFRSAVRFLRANAEKFRIDPGRIGAWGFSAGGWLASSASFSDAGDLCQSRTVTQSKPKRRVHLPFAPYDDPRPSYAEFSSRLNCVVADLWKVPELLRPQSPALLTFVGTGATHKSANKLGGGRMDVLQFTNPKFSGKSSLHVPEITEPVKSLDGGDESTYEEQAMHWLDRQLKGDSVRSVPPEMRPNLRRFRDQITIRLIAASPDATVHFTTDETEPTQASPVFRKPLRIENKTVVKAISVRNGERPSAPCRATFLRGFAPPNITSPRTILLPRATVGKPYRQAFIADGAQVWSLAGMIEPSQRKSRHDVEPGIQLDTKTGVLSGTPKRAGTFTFQIHAAFGYAQQADARCYVLRVDPRATNRSPK